MPSTAYQTLAQRLDQRDASAAGAMIKLAEAGDADAQYKASELCLRGMAGPVDLTQAHRWMAKAAGQGQPEARRAQAYFTAAGVGCSANPDKARSLQTTASSRSSSPSLTMSNAPSGWRPPSGG